MEEPIYKWINQARQSGLSDIEIAKQLQNQGWEDNVIRDLLSAGAKKVPRSKTNSMKNQTPQLNKTRPLVILSFILLVGTILANYLFIREFFIPWPYEKSSMFVVWEAFSFLLPLLNIWIIILASKKYNNGKMSGLYIFFMVITGLQILLIGENIFRVYIYQIFN